MSLADDIAQRMDMHVRLDKRSGDRTMKMRAFLAASRTTGRWPFFAIHTRRKRWWAGGGWTIEQTKPPVWERPNG